MTKALFSHTAKQDITLNMSNILKYTQYLQSKTTITPPPISKPPKRTLTKLFGHSTLSSSCKYPTKDDLFWCFYIMHFGLQKYILIHNFFTEEKSVKIGFVDVIRKNKDILKQHRWKRNQIENNLVHEKNISLTTFICLCVIFNHNFLIIDKRKLYDKRIHSNQKDTHLIMKVDEEWVLYSKDDKENKILKALETLWIIENMEKPLRSIGMYKVKDLKEICQKLQLNCEKKKKKEIYQLICENL